LYWFVRRLRWYYAAVRLPGCVHRRRMVTPFPTRSALDCSAGTDCSMAFSSQALPIPAQVASVHAQVCDPARSVLPLPKRAEPYRLPRALTASAPGSCTLISGLNTGPAHSPVLFPVLVTSWFIYLVASSSIQL